MDIQYFLTFKEVAKWQNFTKAAEKLGYAQSSVTTQIQRLEQEYNTVIFERYGRKMRLTQSGEELLKYANQLVSIYQESKEVIALQERGNLSISTIETLAAFFLPQYLQEFRQAYSNIHVSLEPGIEDRVIQAVKDGEADLGLILDPPFADPELNSILIRQEELVLVASPSHPLAQLKQVEWSDLSSQPMVVTEQGCTYRASFEKVLKARQVQYQLAYELGSMEAIKQCVVYGLGIAWIPKITVMTELEKGSLCTLAFSTSEFSFYTQLIYHKKKRMTPSMKYLIELLAGRAV